MAGPLPTELFKLPVDTTKPCEEFQYAAKVASGPFGDESILTPGRYFTAINIHNPSTCKTVTFRWKLAVAKQLPVSSPSQDLAGLSVGGEISRFQRVTLRPDQAVEIDNPNILEFFKITGGTTGNVKGFVVIESPCELDVVAVYSASSTQTAAQANTALAFHTERVPARKIHSCHDDLILDLSTGKAPWWIVFGIGAPRLANVIEPPDVWAPLPGTKWISFRTSFPAQPPVPPNETVYQTCFSLCSGFEISGPLQLTVLADGGAIEFGVNDSPRVPVAATFSGPGTNVTIPPTQLKPGKNCISFWVKDGTIGPPPQSGGPTGLDVRAIFTIPRGSCSGCACCGSDSLEPPPPSRPVGTPSEA